VHESAKDVLREIADIINEKMPMEQIAIEMTLLSYK